MSKGRKLWLQPGFIANQVVPDYERERNERVKRNNEVLNSLGLKSIATSLWGSAQHKRANDNGKHSKDELDDDYRPPDVENVHAYDSDIDLSLPKRSKSESSPSALVSAQVVATAPATVNQKQYADLVSYWYSTDGQVLSIANKSRRKEKNNPHTAGSKTYAQHAYELEKREEVGVSRTMLYEPTHTKKDGKTPVSDKAAENMNTKGKINWSKNDIYSQVMDEKEHGGRFRGLGFGHTSKSCGSTSNSDARLRVASNEERIREKDNYIVVLEDKLNSAVSELNTVKSVVEFLARQSGFQVMTITLCLLVQDIANGILNQVSPRANQGSSFASHEIEAPLGPSTTVGVVQIGLKQLGSAQF
ncbi:hypothetical protein RHGRI_000114 [Rhododendron griersonianum]|uniref:Uncharacterized protein n=1 Tax=Rhododendron griersonianum TaxID=479676 RepID=A0AAV6LGF7_9ERIC|nr:hypothetical protein RHGRI_000114 [Rhododendron griersonianum]